MVVGLSEIFKGNSGLLRMIWLLQGVVVCCFKIFVVAMSFCRGFDGYNGWLFAVVRFF